MEGYLKKQSQFIRAEFSVLRIASTEVEKTKPMLKWVIWLNISNINYLWRFLGFGADFVKQKQTQTNPISDETPNN